MSDITPKDIAKFHFDLDTGSNDAFEFLSELKVMYTMSPNETAEALGMQQDWTPGTFGESIAKTD